MAAQPQTKTPTQAPQAKKPAMIRAVYGRMVDMVTGAEYVTDEAREAKPSGWLDAQVEAKKLVLE